MKNPAEFYFVFIDEDLITKEIQDLKFKKAIPKNDETKFYLPIFL